MIVGVCPVAVSPSEHARHLEWINEATAVRQAHTLLAQWVLPGLRPAKPKRVVTVWPSHEVYDAWIATPGRDRLTA